jgi:hypothetical protein
VDPRGDQHHGRGYGELRLEHLKHSVAVYFDQASAGAGVSLEPEIEASPIVLVAVGLLVGFGTRLGNGCTSGRGITNLEEKPSESFGSRGFLITMLRLRPP